MPIRRRVTKKKATKKRTVRKVAKKRAVRKVAKKRAVRKVAKKRAVRKVAKKATRKRAGISFFGTGESAFARTRGRESGAVAGIKKSIDWSDLEMDFERELKEGGYSGRDLTSGLDGYVDGVNDGIMSAHQTYHEFPSMRLGSGQRKIRREVELADRYARKLDERTEGGLSSLRYPTLPITAYRMGYEFGFNLYCSEYLCD